VVQVNRDDRSCRRLTPQCGIFNSINAPIDFIDGRCDLRLCPSALGSVSRRAATQSVPVGCIGSARPFARRRRLIHWWRERDSRTPPRSCEREITFETAPLDDSGYLPLRQILAPSLQGPTGSESLSLRHLRIGTRRHGKYEARKACRVPRATPQPPPTALLLSADSGRKMGYAELVDKHHQSACSGFLGVEADAVIGGQVWRYHRFDKRRFAHPTPSVCSRRAAARGGRRVFCNGNRQRLGCTAILRRVWGRG
jgi:hypothetical protein